MEGINPNCSMPSVRPADSPLLLYASRTAIWKWSSSSSSGDELSMRVSLNAEHLQKLKRELYGTNNESASCALIGHEDAKKYTDENPSFKYRHVLSCHLSCFLGADLYDRGAFPLFPDSLLLSHSPWGVNLWNLFQFWAVPLLFSGDNIQIGWIIFSRSKLFLAKLMLLGTAFFHLLRFYSGQGFCGGLSPGDLSSFAWSNSL